MKVSLLCGTHYEGAEPYRQAPLVPPALCDPDVAQQSFDHFLATPRSRTSSALTGWA